MKTPANKTVSSRLLMLLLLGQLFVVNIAAGASSSASRRPAETAPRLNRLRKSARGDRHDDDHIVEGRRTKQGASRGKVQESTGEERMLADDEAANTSEEDYTSMSMMAASYSMSLI